MRNLTKALLALVVLLATAVVAWSTCIGVLDHTNTSGTAGTCPNGDLNTYGYNVDDYMRYGSGPYNPPEDVGNWTEVVAHVFFNAIPCNASPVVSRSDVIVPQQDGSTWRRHLLQLGYRENSQGAPTCPVDEDEVFGCYTPPPSPLLFPFEPRLELTNVENGASFDLFGIGTKAKIGWTKANSEDAWLTSTTDVKSIKDLWGTESEQAPALDSDETENGYRALRLKDENGDGKIDSSDSIYGSLYLWFDRNHDAISQPEEIEPLSNRVKSISLDYQHVGRRDKNGNFLKFQSRFQPNSGQARWSYDVFPVLAPYTVISESVEVLDPLTGKPRP